MYIQPRHWPELAQGNGPGLGNQPRPRESAQAQEISPGPGNGPRPRESAQAQGIGPGPGGRPRAKARPRPGLEIENYAPHPNLHFID